MGANLGRYNQKSLLGADIMLNGLPEPGGYIKVCQDIIFPGIKDTDFEDMYKDGGRPPVSPRLLMCVTILQFLERLPDRQTIQNLIYRLDWKVALELELEYPGFSYQLLSVWRQRVVEHDRAKRVFDGIIEELKDRGLIKKNGKQRIDSTHVLAEIKELTRVELMTETLRLAVIDLRNMGLNFPNAIDEIISTYETGINLYQLGSKEREKILKEAGQNMLKLQEYINKKIPSQKRTKNINTLETVFEQNFTVNESGRETELIKVSTGKDHICSPHDTEARYGSKHKNIGYKAQIVETAERDKTNFIIDVEEEDNEETDHGKLMPAVNRVGEKDLKPKRVYTDQGYVDGDTLSESSADGIEVYGPIDDGNKALRDEFNYDEAKDKYICPAGKISQRKYEDTNGSTIYQFSFRDCKSCPLKEKCRPKVTKKGKDGRFIRVDANHEHIEAQRELMKTESFKEEMKNRNAIEGTISGMKRGFNFFRCRYRGKKKFRLQLFFTAIAFNIKRLDLAYNAI